MRHDEILAARRELGATLWGKWRGQVFSGFTGTMAAGLGANAAVGGVRFPVTGVGRFGLTWMHLHFVCISGFTAAVTPTRRLTLRRGSGGNPSGGTDLDVSRDSSQGTETLLTGQIANTGALTMSGVTLETPAKRRLLLTTKGNAGDEYDELWTWRSPLWLEPGELAVISNGTTAMEAAGTWQLNWSGGGVGAGV